MEMGVLYITLHHPPYNDEDILSKINWKQKDVTITEVRQGEIIMMILHSENMVKWKNKIDFSKTTEICCDLLWW